MDEQERLEAVAPGQLAQELPAALVVRPVVRVLELLAGPEDRSLGADVEPVGVEHRSLVVVAQQGHLAVFHHQVDALARVRAVADDVAQAIDLGDPLGLDVGQDDFEGFEVPVNIADQGAAHRGEPPSKQGFREGIRKPWKDLIVVAGNQFTIHLR